MTEETAKVLINAGVDCTCRGPVAIKGKGTLTTYFVDALQDTGSSENTHCALRRGASYYSFKADEHGALLRQPLSPQVSTSVSSDTPTSRFLGIPKNGYKPLMKKSPEISSTPSNHAKKDVPPKEDPRTEVKITKSLPLPEELKSTKTTPEIKLQDESDLQKSEEVLRQEIENVTEERPKSVSETPDDHMMKIPMTLPRSSSHHSNISIEPENQSIVLPLGTNFDVRVPLFQDAPGSSSSSAQQSIVIVNNIYSGPITTVNVANSVDSPSISIINIHPVVTAAEGSINSVSERKHSVINFDSAFVTSQQGSQPSLESQMKTYVFNKPKPILKSDHTGIFINSDKDFQTTKEGRKVPIDDNRVSLMSPKRDRKYENPITSTELEIAANILCSSGSSSSVVYSNFSQPVPSLLNTTKSNKPHPILISNSDESTKGITNGSATHPAQIPLNLATMFMHIRKVVHLFQ